jgi:hypothetical protein
MRVRWPLLVPLAALAAAAACKDPQAQSAPRAGDEAAWLAARADADVTALEAALPGAAAALAGRFSGPDDPRGDVNALHDAIVRARADAPALDAGPSQFFAVLDGKGVVLRNDLVTDEMAGHDFFAEYPGLAGARAGLVEKVAPAEGGGERWIAGVPAGPDAELVTGFTYRALAGRLSDALRTRLEAEARDAGRPDALPVAYVAVFDARGVYVAPHTPAADEDALRAADLVAKTAAGAFAGTIVIAGRTFGAGAARAPKLGDATGVAVLRSEI